MKLYEKLLLGTAGAAGAGTVAWRTMFPWIGYDFQLIGIRRRLNKVMIEAFQSKLIDEFERQVENHPKNPFIVFEDFVYTYEFVDQMACKVANIVKTWGLKPRDTVAIMITNEPAFIWTFFGLQKLGIAVAFINYNLKMDPLVHSVKASKTKYLIVGDGKSLLENIMEIKEELNGVKIYVQALGNSPPPLGLHSFDPLMVSAHSSGIDPLIRKDLNLRDVCCYIYTSGTTGNPKPAIIQHNKAIAFSLTLSLVDFKSSDILYLNLPLYHSAGFLGMLSAMRNGAKVILKRKFSASQFWIDCCKYDVTVIQYIGELLRYLLAQPPSKYDTEHKVRVACGNGLRKDIWNDFSKRFKIPLIGEFFGATEGIAMMLNVANKPGAIGRLSPFLSALDPDPKALVKVDYGTAQPIRDKNGRCIKVKLGEPGLFLCKLPDLFADNGSFTPYMSSKEANEKKLVRGAFKDGDIYFNFGDVFVLDNEYFIYFVDRIGDTFRWKGENVSTTELANMITKLNFVQDANVYGVLIPGHDGRAGMVALTLNNGHKLGDKELKELFDHMKESLPEYAQPLFVRLLDQAIITGTFKQKKVELAKEAYDLDKVKDSLYFRDLTKGTYSTLTKADLPKFLTSKL